MVINSISSQTLLHQKCVPCEGGIKPLTDAEESAYLSAIPGWKIDRSGAHQLKKGFTFKNFKMALDGINRIGVIAESEGHHPNLYLHDFKKLDIELTTHAIGGLSVNDFILATKISALKLES